MSVALYARVSSDKQREEGTIASQLQELRQFAERESLCLDERHIYLDEGKSGYYLDRPGLDALRDAARDGLVDLVLMHDPDRLSRKYAYQVLLLEEFKRWQVDIRFLKQPPAESDEQRLLVQIQGVIAEYERARIMERTRRGRLYWARQGHPVCGRVPYGYRYAQRERKERPAVEVDAEAAEVVRQIFGWYVTDRLSGQQIAQQLTNREIVPPRGRRSYWDPSTVRFILTNEAYVGSWYLNRFRMEPRAEPAAPPSAHAPTAGVDSRCDSRADRLRGVSQGTGDQSKRMPPRPVALDPSGDPSAAAARGLWKLQSGLDQPQQHKRRSPLLLVSRN
jgi:site-specific DNA recombinase